MEAAELLADAISVLWKVAVPSGSFICFTDLSGTATFCLCSAFGCSCWPLLSTSPISCGNDNWKVGLLEEEPGQVMAVMSSANDSHVCSERIIVSIS